MTEKKWQKANALECSEFKYLKLLFKLVAQCDAVLACIVPSFMLIKLRCER